MHRKQHLYQPTADNSRQPTVDSQEATAKRRKSKDDILASHLLRLQELVLVSNRYLLLSVGHRLSAVGPFLSAFGCQLSAHSYLLSAVSYRLSAIGSRLSALGYRLSAIGYRLSAIGYRQINQFQAQDLYVDHPKRQVTI